MNRAYSLLTIKSVNDDERVIEGIATTPAADRMGDIVEPEGAQFSLPIPLLWQHDSGAPIGHVTEAKIGKDGISIKAKLVKLDEPGQLKDRLDLAWQSIKAGLVRGLSIGFMPLESESIKGTWSEHYLKWDWMELSAVTIPANAEASILSIKSADQAMRAASGNAQRPVVRLTTPAGATAIPPSKRREAQGANMKTVAEQIAAFEAKRAASTARREEIQTKAIAEGRSKDDAEKEEFATLTAEIKSIDDELVDLRLMESQVVSKATVIDPAKVNARDAGNGAEVVRSGNIIAVSPNVEKGVKFARYAMALYRAEGDTQKALSIFTNEKRWMDTTPEVATVLKAAVAAGDTTTSGWASELVYNQNLAAEFIEYLRPMTILGKISTFRRVPFNVRMASQTSTSTGYWVGQGAPIPVSKPGVSSQSLGIAKAAGIVAIDEELARSSSPSAELLVRDDLARTIATFLDVQLLDPNIAAVANVNPASLTNGVTAVAATGATAAAFRTDMATLMKSWAQSDLDASKGVFIMTPNQALNIGLLLNSLGLPLYDGININGGTLLGLPVITSNSANIPGSPDSGNMIILLNPPEIFLADDGQVTVDMSREASIQMLDNPTNTSTGATAATTMVSMFQTHSIALRATRFINWSKRRTNALVYIKEAAYLA